MAGFNWVRTTLWMMPETHNLTHQHKNQGGMRKESYIPFQPVCEYVVVSP